MQQRDKKVMEYAIQKKGSNFLEIGGGDFGYKNFGKLTKNYYSIDVNEKLKIPNLVIQDLEKNPVLPFKDNFFDCVLLLDVLEHLNNRHEIVGEIKRVAKKDALILISLPNEFSYQPVWYHIKGVNWMSGAEHGHKYMYDVKSAREYVSKHFKIESEEYFWLDGKLGFLGKLNQYLAKKYPRWFARNILYKCRI
jgi:ubiquinone/menaquinone biosynthesis C-methylase UbiE